MPSGLWRRQRILNCNSRPILRRPKLVSGDADRLQQVVVNLLSNAIKFTPENGRVDVSIKRAGPNLELAVEDTGEGISPDFLPHVFDRFRQADGATSRRHTGLGLGLAIVRQLVELHGGTVRADSSGPGKGAKFTVRLPILTSPRVRQLRSRAAEGRPAPAAGAARWSPRPGRRGQCRRPRNHGHRDRAVPARG